MNISAMHQYINNLAQQQIELYIEQPSRMLSDYQRERRNIDDYNGRQLLELIQNADDEGANHVCIILDSKKRTLTVSNTGKPFSEKGYQSLMLSDLSSKTKESYIGNKGLGFRSIINWSESVCVRSNDLDVTFSSAIAEKLFVTKFDKKQRDKILSDRGLSKSAKPWAILAVPSIEVCECSEWATEILIKYREEYYKDIVEQLKDLEEELLIFLNNISLLEVFIDNRKNVFTKSVKGKRVNINGKEWEILEEKDELPEHYQDVTKEALQHYQLKLALPDELNFTSKKLYTYFPTKINLDFPFIVHGTFDLDSSRNQLIKNDRNSFVLERLVHLIVKCTKRLSEERVSWEPFKLLCYANKNEVLDVLGFYETLDEIKYSLPIYPCVDSTYKKFEEVKYIGRDFSDLLIDLELSNIFPEILIPITDDIYGMIETFRISNVSNFEERIRIISQRIAPESLNHRVNLILSILDYDVGEKLPLLINDNGNIIEKTESVFTPLTSNQKTPTLPNFVHLEFLSKELCELLIIALDIPRKDKYRELQRVLKKITNIRTYEPAELIEKVVRSANKEVGGAPSNAVRITKDLVSCLFNLYSTVVDQEGTFPEDLRIKLLNREGELVYAKELFLSREYYEKDSLEQILSDKRSNKDLVTPPKELFKEKFDIDLVKKFLLWVGVNKFVRYENIKITDEKGVSNDYIELLKEINRERLPSDIRYTSVLAKAIKDEDIIFIKENYSKEEIVLWSLVDDEAKSRLLGLKKDEARYSKLREYTGSFYHFYQIIPSYIFNQINNLNIFCSHWISEDKLSEIVNGDVFNYEFCLKHNSSKYEIDMMLSKLGAKESFISLPIEHVNLALKRLPDIDKFGRNSQKLYKLALEHYQNNNIPMSNDLLLYANTGEDSGYYLCSDVYYSDNIRLPSKLVSHKPIFNFPKRRGAKQVPKCFNVKNLNDVQVEVNSFEPVEKFTKTFNEKFENIKPYILAYRLENLHKNKEQQASTLNGINIVLCSAVSCKSEDSDFVLDDNDYVKENNSFYIKIDSSKSFINLLTDFDFGDTFAEILCLSFDINEYKNEFRMLLRNDDSYCERLIRKELGNEALIESREKLNISDFFVSFWKSVFSILSIPTDFEIDSKSISDISNILKVSTKDLSQIEYENFDKENLIQILDLFAILGVSVKEFNQHAYYKISLSMLHEIRIKNIFYNYQKKFYSLLWKKCEESKDIEFRKQYLNLRGQFLHQEDWIQEVANTYKEEEKPDFKFMINELIKDKFQVNLFDDVSNFNYEDIYTNNLGLLELEAEPDFDEAFISLLFFKDHVNLVKEYLEKQKTDSEQSENRSSLEGVPLKPFPQNPSSITSRSTEGTARKPKKAAKFSGSKEKAKKEIGKKAELIVYQSLLKEFGSDFVIYDATNDDTVGYDLKYKTNIESNWIYVEVKSFTGTAFYVSKNEFEFSKDNYGSYELFLVDSNQDIHRFINVDFEDESKFNLQSSEYQISCKITC